jgi:hypothetical protein
MRPQSLIALVRDMQPGPVPPELSVWPTEEWSAIVTPYRLRPRLGRRAALRAAATRQTWLEALLPRGTVLPALNGTRLALADLPRLICANGAALAAQADALAGRVQFQITIRCDLARARRMIDHPALRAVPNDRWQGRFAALTAERLAALPGAALIALPVAQDVAANMALLLPASTEPQLDAALEELDALWPEGLNIRQIGPSPAVSFASFGLHRITATDLANAERLLGLPPGAPAADIRQARQTALRHPEARVDVIRAAATLLTQARTLARPDAFPQVHFWTEGRAERPDAKAAVA